MNKSIRFGSIHEIITAPGNTLDLNDLCKTAGVSRFGYYNCFASEQKGRKKNFRIRLTSI